MDCLRLPEDAGKKLRQGLGLGPSEDLRVSYVTGPGDVVGTHTQWKQGKTDARVPIFAYSTMFYELVTRLEAQAQLLCNVDGPPSPTPPFAFCKLPLPDTRDGVRYRISQTRRIRAALREIDAYKPHLIVASSNFPSQAWPALARRGRLVVSLHNTFWPMGRPLTGIRGQLRLRSLRRSARSIQTALCISDECARQIALLTDHRVSGRVVCPQLPETYASIAREQARRLLFLGRIEENKGIFLLLDVVRDLMRTRPDLTLTFAGSGTAEAAFRARIAAAETSQIRFVGRLDSAGVHAALSENDLLVCPTMTSFNEGLAVVGFEAAAHGVPSVLSSVVPAKDLLAPCAAIFQADDGAALRSELRVLIDSPEAYHALAQGTDTVKAMIYDRTRSWGSQLYAAMLDAVGVHP